MPSPTPPSLLNRLLIHTSSVKPGTGPLINKALVGKRTGPLINTSFVKPTGGLKINTPPTGLTTGRRAPTAPPLVKVLMRKGPLTAASGGRKTDHPTVGAAMDAIAANKQGLYHAKRLPNGFINVHQRETGLVGLWDPATGENRDASPVKPERVLKQLTTDRSRGQLLKKYPGPKPFIA